MTSPASPSPKAVADGGNGMDGVLQSLRHPLLVTAIRHLGEQQLREAETLIRRRLAEAPDDALALTMMGDLTFRLGINDQAKTFLIRALEIAPGFDDARFKLAQVFRAAGNSDQALATLKVLTDRDPDHLDALKARERIFAETGEYRQALDIHARLIRLEPDKPGPLLRQGNALRTLGQTDEAVRSYRDAIAIDPHCAEVWWSLANLKSYRFDNDEIARMQTLVGETPHPTDRMYFHFALGKAFEDRREYASSFEHYAAGNSDRLIEIPHNRENIQRRVDDAIEFYTPAFFESRMGVGAAATDPIFIIGMPRAGSTLLEQILSSHSQIEGTSELPEMPTLVRRLVTDRWQDVSARYPEVVGQLDRSAFADLGEWYLANTARHRKGDRPYFIDKLPMNWLQVGLIHLILPNATIIDARREAMACCFANFKQHFARGQSFAYSLADIGHYYRQYVRLMDHWDTVLPGRVIRLQHEDLLDDPEREIRRVLDAIGLPFEESCLRFHENDRAVRTPSAEQVRRPINRDAVDLWRHYEPWLDDLKSALGPLAP
jgi:tetratricopeptide (TPR) repeat protein